MQKIVASFKQSNPKIPFILYSQPSNHLIELLAETQADALSVDWRAPIGEFAKRLPRNMTLQGNLDPIVTTLNWESAKPHVDEVLMSAKSADILNRFIFNVGHGVTPHTKADTLAQIVEYVHNFK
jgi:uroporphyrinogen decarboxylase